MKIGFLTPYVHLPEFTEFVEKEFECIDLHKNPQQVDFIFTAPNYKDCTVTDEEVLKFKPKAILTPSTGSNHIRTTLVPILDIRKDKILDHIPSTAEHNLFLILSLVRNAKPIRQLGDLTLGILGYGRLGKMLHRKCKELFKSVEYKDINTQSANFFSDTDVVSLNINLTEDNTDLINSEYISRFSKNIFIINTSRGEIINEVDLIKELEARKVLGYATDVVKEEDSDISTPLKEYPTSSIFIVTPHIGGTAIGAQELAYKRIITKTITQYGTLVRV